MQDCLCQTIGLLAELSILLADTIFSVSVVLVLSSLFPVLVVSKEVAFSLSCLPVTLFFITILTKALFSLVSLSTTSSLFLS